MAGARESPDVLAVPTRMTTRRCQWPMAAAATRSQGFRPARVTSALIAIMSVEPGTNVPIMGIASENASRKVAAYA